MVKMSDDLQRLKEILTGMESVLIGYSGGVDSTFLLWVAHEVLGDKVLAVTARSETYPEREYDAAVDFVARFGIPHQTIHTSELAIPNFSANPPDRCYYCKRELFEQLREIADDRGIRFLADGTNADDLDDYRPGLKALEELGVRSPLEEAGLTKEAIRSYSREMGLPTWDKPAYACLSSRFPYGTEITEGSLDMVNRAETVLLDLELKQVRVRHHGTIARIELAQEDIPAVIDHGIRRTIVARLKEIGYAYVVLDLEGYRTGSMNEVLKRGDA